MNRSKRRHDTRGVSIAVALAIAAALVEVIWLAILGVSCAWMIVNIGWPRCIAGIVGLYALTQIAAEMFDSPSKASTSADPPYPQ
ncbi:MAG: hypothetical protein QOJ33_1708 [Chloroflexota bacterium]|nr:hypothetical protein [Chloroflexota bacterium]